MVWFVGGVSKSFIFEYLCWCGFVGVNVVVDEIEFECFDNEFLICLISEEVFERLEKGEMFICVLIVNL